MSERQGLNRDEVSRLLEKITDPRDRAIIVLGLRHGFRSSEITELRLSDIDMDHASIRIKRGKGSETNHHKITDRAPYFELTVLQSALTERPDDESDYVFVSQKGGKLHRSQIFRIFQQAAEQAGLPKSKRHYHCCKHTAAFSMLKGGATLPEVQKRFGWKSLATVGAYLAVSDETAETAADKAEQAFESAA
jgi:integrase